MSFDLVRISHLRWDFVFQRPQYLLSFYVQESIVAAAWERLDISQVRKNVRVVEDVVA